MFAPLAPAPSLALMLLGLKDLRCSTRSIFSRDNAENRSASHAVISQSFCSISDLLYELSV
jgi:hypothetical protein